ncbi:hypothetical protein CRG98_013016 [Punica granatum]|uniref:Uncharacterized protein n=1 Tax=Punica granatum TaxID=22663 RepID=A0A2I0KDK2_PUNGR|nr:hypothetical protein CRG98_013016 [Punica granatum]
MRIVMKLLHRCSALGVVVCLICRKPALLLGRLLVALPGVGFIAGAIVVCWGCPGRAMRNSSSGVERLRISRGRKSESVVVLVFVVPVILTSLLSCVGEPIGNRVGVDNLAISLGDTWTAQCAKAQGDCFVHLSFYSPFATVTHLGAVPLNLKGMNSPFAMTARLGIFSRASLLP